MSDEYDDEENDHGIGVTHKDIFSSRYANAMMVAMDRLKSEWFPEHLSLIEDTNEVASCIQGHIMKMGREALLDHYRTMLAEGDEARRDLSMMTLGILYGRVLQEFDAMTIINSMDDDGKPSILAGKNP